MPKQPNDTDTHQFQQQQLQQEQKLSSTNYPPHPLKNLTSNEIQAVANAVRHYHYNDDTTRTRTTTTTNHKNNDDDHGNYTPRHPNMDETQLRFVALTLKEPKKDEMIRYYQNTNSNDTNQNGIDRPKRFAEVVTMNPVTGLGSEYFVELITEQTAIVISCETLPAGVQPMLTPDDCELAELLIHQSTEIATILYERYNITNIKQVSCDPWSIHLASDEEIQLTQWDCSNGTTTTGKPGRLVQTFLYYRMYGDDYECNHNAHPIDILPTVDLNARKVIDIFGLDRLPPPKIPVASVNFHRKLLSTNTYLEKSWRNETLRPYIVSQPEGPSFTVSTDDNNTVSWQKWSIQVGFNYREGIVLHNIKFDGRSIVNRASLVEMAVPYGDVHPPFQRKCAFDIGDYGLGYCANSLELGCDCLGHIYYFDFHVIDSAGTPILKPKVVCMHEQDDGLLWKHVEYRNGYNESRRSRVLIISSIATVVNYEYLFYWIFTQDGTMEYEIKLSGELSTNLLSSVEEKRIINNVDGTSGNTGDNDNQPNHGVIVAPAVNAQFHQHLFCVRLDMAIDGPDNTVSEIDIVRQPYDAITNPYGNGFSVQETILPTEQEAVRVADPTKARCWKISSHHCRNLINHKPTAYKLIPYTFGPAQPTLLADPMSALTKKGMFATANLWVTKYNDKERFPSGEYTPQQVGPADGLPKWIEQNRDIVGTDIVVWHSFGVCHIPRIEDFPVSSV
jgi:primary-amine oxidase